MSYLVNDISISEFLNAGYAEYTAANAFAGFPAGLSNYQQTICSCLPFGYQIDGTDVSVYYRGYQIGMESNGSNNVRQVVDLTDLKRFKHMKVF